MSKFEISGPNKLQGEIQVLGAKNAAMKMIAACVLITGKVTLENVPDILDIQIIIDILTNGGARIRREGHILEIDTTNLTDKNPDPNLVKKMRGSIVLIGPYLSRFGRISIPHPGGCVIGSRPIDIHLRAFRNLGAEVKESDNFYSLNISKIDGKNINFEKKSVTATENVILNTCLANGITKITNAAREPEIVDLVNFLNSCGAKIRGAGTETIIIKGVDKLVGTTYTVMPDRIEAGTFACLALVTKSALKIINCEPKHLQSFLDKLTQIGAQFEIGEDYLYIKESDDLTASDIITHEYPGFATDLQAPIGLILTQCNGTSRIKENIHENRLNYLKELEKMGAKFDIISNNEAEIYGPATLHGAHIESLDLRAGATLILAGLAACGKTTILNAEIVDRGYENIENRLKKLGASIQRINS